MCSMPPQSSATRFDMTTESHNGALSPAVLRDEEHGLELRSFSALLVASASAPNDMEAQVNRDD
jgi:hypothetical protein